MQTLIAILVYVVILLVAGLVFLLLVPSYLSSIGGYKNRKSLIEFGSWAAFISVALYLVVPLLVYGLKFNVEEMVQLSGVDTGRFSSLLPFVRGMVESWFFRSKWAIIAFSTSLELAILTAIIFLIIICRDKTQKKAPKNPRNYTLEFQEKSKNALHDLNA